MTMTSPARFGMQTLAQPVAIAIQSAGDGSHYAVGFSSEKEAARYADMEEALGEEQPIDVEPITKVYDSVEEWARDTYNMPYDQEELQARLDYLA